MTDAEKREKIPTRADVPTKYQPMRDLMMVVPLEEIKKVGSLILPDSASIRLNEGHVVQKGPHCTEDVQVGDCVTWDINSEYQMNVDDVRFVLVRESCCTMKIPRLDLLAPTTPSPGSVFPEPHGDVDMANSPSEITPPPPLYSVITEGKTRPKDIYWSIVHKDWRDTDLAHHIGKPVSDFYAVARLN